MESEESMAGDGSTFVVHKDELYFQPEAGGRPPIVPPKLGFKDRLGELESQVDACYGVASSLRFALTGLSDPAPPREVQFPGVVPAISSVAHVAKISNYLADLYKVLDEIQKAL